MRLRVLDFETTGTPPDAAVCEIGFVDVRTYVDDPPEIGDPVWSFVNPRRPIPPEARAVHHISDEDVAGAPAIEVGYRVLGEGFPSAFVAHNAKFEQEFYTGGDTPWICTLKVARRLWPDCPSHSNQCLRYYLDLQLDAGMAAPPHRAAPDAYVTAHILVEALKLASVEQMIAWSKEPSLLTKVNFGKHRGSAWSDLPADYLSWIVHKSDMDEDTKYTARHHLSLRSRA